MQPRTVSGLTSSTLGSMAVCVNRASAAMRTPAVMQPPMYSPAWLTASNVVAVPKSNTIRGAPYLAMAPIQATARSGPSRSSPLTP